MTFRILFRSTALAAVCLCLAWAASAEIVPTVPDDKLTPGVIASTDESVVCATGPNGTYSQQHRQTSAAMKADVYRRYGIVKGNRSFEVDHRIPLALGGKDDIENLWPQPGFGHPNFHDKDKLEVYLWESVCKHHTMPLKQAQWLLQGDWIKAYQQTFGQAP